MCPELHETFIWVGDSWNTCSYNVGNDKVEVTFNEVLENNARKFGVEIDHGISPNDFDSYTFLVWLKVATPEELEAYNKLGQNFRVSTEYAKSLIEPEKSLDEEFEKEVQKHIEDICEWKIQEVMDDYEDELESKLLF